MTEHQISETSQYLNGRDPAKPPTMDELEELIIEQARVAHNDTTKIMEHINQQRDQVIFKLRQDITLLSDREYNHYLEIKTILADMADQLHQEALELHLQQIQSQLDALNDWFDELPRELAPTPAASGAPATPEPPPDWPIMTSFVTVYTNGRIVFPRAMHPHLTRTTKYNLERDRREPIITLTPAKNGPYQATLTGQYSLENGRFARNYIPPEMREQRYECRLTQARTITVHLDINRGPMKGTA